MAPAAAGSPSRWRASRKWLAAQATIAAPSSGADPTGAEPGTGAVPIPMQVRFGITVGKRNARLSVQRSAVKRVLREAARHHAAALDRAAGARRVDVVLRLKTALPAAAELGAAELRSQLRQEAESMLGQLAAQLLRQTQPAAPAGAAS